MINYVLNSQRFINKGQVLVILGERNFEDIVFFGIFSTNDYVYNKSYNLRRHTEQGRGGGYLLVDRVFRVARGSGLGMRCPVSLDTRTLVPSSRYFREIFVGFLNIKDVRLAQLDGRERSGAVAEAHPLLGSMSMTFE